LVRDSVAFTTISAVFNETTDVRSKPAVKNLSELEDRTMTRASDAEIPLTIDRFSSHILSVSCMPSGYPHSS
jgi:hypothetical protein